MTGEAAGVRRVAVIGAGTIGASWATLFLARGLDVAVSDPAPNAESDLRRRIAD
jgi:carnitine 3-dehydrogenase